MSMSRSKKRAIVITAVSIPLAFLLVIMPTATVIVYEAIFGATKQPPEWLSYSVEEFDGLTVERSDFSSDGTELAGFRYAKAGVSPKGVVVIAHGLGGDGHNVYMPFIAYFAEHGYAVFAYDAHGNGQSGGNSVRGLPQGLIDLDHALCHVKSLEVYRDLPILLFGHSWGGYSVGNVLSFHPDVEAAVMIAGFNESEDMLSYQAGKYAGPTVEFGMLYLDLYEKLKFGKEYADMSAVEAMGACDAEILVVHGGADGTVPAAYGYGRIYDEFEGNERFGFLFYEDRGHEDVFYSDGARAYREQLRAEYAEYLAAEDREDNEKTQAEFVGSHLDKKRCFEPDPELMAQILILYDECCEE